MNRLSSKVLALVGTIPMGNLVDYQSILWEGERSTENRTALMACLNERLKFSIREKLEQSLCMDAQLLCSEGLAATGAPEVVRLKDVLNQLSVGKQRRR